MTNCWRICAVERLDKPGRGFHAQQLLGVVKGDATVDTDNLEKLEIAVVGALGKAA